MVGGDSVVHLSGLVLLARALATGEATLILQAFQNKSFASNPPANKLRASIKNPLKWVENCLPPNRKMRPIGSPPFEGGLSDSPNPEIRPPDPSQIPGFWGIKRRGWVYFDEKSGISAPTG